MTDTKRLKQKIKDKGLKHEFLASACGITPRTFYNKLNGKNEFSQEEILVLKRILELSDTEVIAIFFADKVDDSSPDEV